MNDSEIRFVKAYNELKSSGAFDLAGFAEAAGACQSVISEFVNGKRGRQARVAWFAALCSFGVSGDWLLTGHGSMWQKRKESEKRLSEN